MKKILTHIPALTIILFSFSCNQNSFLFENKGEENGHRVAKIVIFNVGEGDAILIESPNSKRLLIDGGQVNEGYRTILPHLKYYNVSSIDYIIASHFHADHIGGLPEIICGLDGIKGTLDDIMIKDGVYDHGLDGEDLPLMKSYLEAFGEMRKEINLYTNFYFEDDFNIDVLAVNCKTHVKTLSCNDENERSVAVSIQFGKFKFLTMGDLTGGGYETKNIERLVGESSGQISLLKASHHGSKTSSQLDFLNIVKPLATVISTGTNDYGHPHCDVIENLSTINSDIYMTSGTIDHCDNGKARIVNDNIEIFVIDGEWMVIDGINYVLE